MTDLTYNDIREALAELRAEMTEVRQTYGQYAQEFKSAQRDWKKEWAIEFLKVEGKNKEEREARVIQNLWQSKAYVNFVTAEANWTGAQARLDAIKQDAMILMALLKDEKDLSGGRGGADGLAWTGGRN